MHTKACQKVRSSQNIRPPTNGTKILPCFPTGGFKFKFTKKQDEKICQKKHIYPNLVNPPKKNREKQTKKKICKKTPHPSFIVTFVNCPNFKLPKRCWNFDARGHFEIQTFRCVSSFRHRNGNCSFDVWQLLGTSKTVDRFGSPHGR